MQPPIARRDNQLDPYSWMRHATKPDAPHLVAERAYYNARIVDLDPTVRTVSAELLARTPDTERSVGRVLGPHTYYRVTTPGQELPKLERKSDTGPDETVLDLAEFGSPYAATGVAEPNPDGVLLAYSLDLTGAERYRLRFRNMADGTDLTDADGRLIAIADTYYTGAWAGVHFFYTVIDELNRPYEVHRLDPRTGANDVVLTEPDQRFELTIERSGDYIVIASHSRTTSECWAIPVSEPTTAAISLGGRIPGVEYDVEWDVDRWLTLSNARESEFELLANQEPIGPNDGRIHEILALNNAIVTYSRVDGQGCIRILERDGLIRREIPPEPGGAIRLGHNVNPDATFVTIITESFFEPTTWWDVDLVTGERTLRHRREVPGHDATKYCSEVVRATAPDGWSVPIVLTRHRDTALDSTAPCLLYGYGAYESIDDPWFDTWVLPLLDRGVVIAKAHIRGGGEISRQQWIEGHLLAKRNTFVDYITAADYLAGDLVGSALVDGSRIVSRGLSAGGLLQGAVAYLAPRRWAGVIAEVPFVDCLNSMLDPDIPLTVNEWEEWGDPRIPTERDYLASYSPYFNLPEPHDRPALFVTGAVHDPRVLVHEPAKWVAALRHSDPASGDRPRLTDRGSIVFRVELGEGAHGGQSGRYAALGYEAELIAWALSAMEIKGD
ncbi:MAG: prolyl oligopeptidase family serine peptidase [Actinobacteria bacterium]|nr:prolyl oligopeptidase family serine peptidase [Actinomycetota bacterium]